MHVNRRYQAIVAIIHETWDNERVEKCDSFNASCEGVTKWGPKGSLKFGILNANERFFAYLGRCCDWNERGMQSIDDPSSPAGPGERSR